MLSSALTLLAICATIQVSPIVAASWSTSLAIKLTWSTSGMVLHQPSGFCRAMYSSANAVTHYERKVCDFTSQATTYTYSDSDCTAQTDATVVSTPLNIGTETMSCVEIGTWADPAITSLKNFRNDACTTQCKEDHFLANYCNVFTAAVVIAGNSYLSQRYNGTGYGSTTYTDHACTSGPRPAVTGTAATCGATTTTKCQDESTLATEAYSVVTTNTQATLPGKSASSDDNSSSGIAVWKLVVGIALAGTLVFGLTVTAVLWAGAKPNVNVALEKEKERFADKKDKASDTEMERDPLSHRQSVPDCCVGGIKIDLPLEVQTPAARTKQESSQKESSDPDDESDEESEESDEPSEMRL